MSDFKVILTFLIASILGYLVVPLLSIDLLPTKKLPVLLVSYTLKDATPEIVEQQATAPIENVLSQLSQLKSISSISNHHQGTIEIRFDNDANIEMKKFEVQSSIRNIYNELNQNISYPIVEQRSNSTKAKSPLLAYRINANLAPFQIRKAIDDLIIPILSQHRGVSNVSVQGAEDLQLTIEFDQNMLRQLQVLPSTITAQLKMEFSSFFPGSLLTAGNERITIKAAQSPGDIESVRNLLVTASNGQHYRLGKLASVFWEEGKPRQYFRINGMNSIVLTVYADESVNKLAVARDIQKSVELLKSTLPAGFNLIEDYDDTDFLRKEIVKNIFRSTIAFLSLFIFLLIGYRDVKRLGILLSGILVTFGLTLLCAWATNIQIHLYTIAAATIAFGIVIDNSILVLDSLMAKIVRKISSAIVFASLTTIFALSLLFLLPEEQRYSLEDFCILLSLSISCSVLTAVFYTPALTKYLQIPKSVDHLPFSKIRTQTKVYLNYHRLLLFTTRHRKSIAFISILLFGLPIFLLPVKVADFGWYNKTIGSDFYQERVRPYSDMMLGGSLRLFTKTIYERNGVRDIEAAQLNIRAALPQGNTIADMNKVILAMESYLSGVQGVDMYFTQVYSGQYALVIVKFTKEAETSELPYTLTNRLIALSLEWSGVKWNIYGTGRGFSNNNSETVPNLLIELKGYNYLQLEQYAQSIGAALGSHKRVQKVNTNERLDWSQSNSEELILSLNNSLKQDPRIIASQLRDSYSNEVPSTSISIGDQRFPVYLRPKGKTISIYDLLETPLLMADSQQVKLSSIAEIKRQETSSSINKLERQYVRRISFDYFGSYKFANEFVDDIISSTKLELKPGYTIKKLIQSRDESKSKHYYELIFLLMLGVFIIGSIAFESFTLPILIILAIPFSFTGLFFGFWLFDVYLDQGGLASFILLGGLVVNACIYVINDIKIAKTSGYRNPVSKAVAGKFKPIILTISSTCLGLMPFVFSGPEEVFWFALAIGTISGLIFSVFVIFILLPTFLGVQGPRATSNKPISNDRSE